MLGPIQGSYILAWPERMDSLNCGLVKLSAASKAAWILGCARHQLRRGDGKFAIKDEQSFAGFMAGHAQQIGFSRVQILRVARIGDPHGLVVSQHAGEPVDLGEQVVQALLVVGLGEEKLLLPAAVEARGHGHRLAIAGLEKFELAKVDRLADRVVDEGLGVGLLHGGHNLGKGDGDGGGDLGVQVVRAAVGQVHFAVDDVGVGAGGGAMKGPLELAEGDGQSAERDVALGARIAQALCLRGKVRGHLGQQVRLVEVETPRSVRA